MYIHLHTGVTAPPIFPDMDDKHASQRASLYKAIVNEGVFNPNMVYSNVHWFFNMGFHEQYFRRYELHTSQVNMLSLFGCNSCVSFL